MAETFEDAQSSQHHVTFDASEERKQVRFLISGPVHRRAEPTVPTCLPPLSFFTHVVIPCTMTMPYPH